MNLHNNLKNISGYFLFLGYFQLKKLIIQRKKVIKIKLRQRDIKIKTSRVTGYNENREQEK